MKVLLLCALVAVALSQPHFFSEEDESEWDQFKIEHEKDYGDNMEENLRKEIFMENLNFIREHNEKYENGDVTFTVRINQFSDLTDEEFQQTMNCYRVPEGYARKGDKFELDETLDLPKTVDWRTKGAVTPVKDQGQCRSCWAFSATGSLEGQIFLKTKKLPSLSEQNLVDCSRPQGNHGCGGGLMDDAFKYVKQNKGINTEGSYPYEAKDNFCRYKSRTIGATCSGYVDVTSGSEEALQQAVATVGPVSVAIDAEHSMFRHYDGGILKVPDCSSTKLTHAVLAVGYGTSESDGDYWIVKNSWGENWGMKGYVLMARNHNNMCGIASHASYPTV